METETLSPRDPMLLLTLVAVVLYFLFQVTLIYSALTLEGDCLYTFWLPSRSTWTAPYWSFAFLVGILMLWSLVTLGKKLFAKRRVWPHIAYYVVAVLAIGYWAYDLMLFWRTMEYERGAISGEEYYHGSIVHLTVVGAQPACRSDT